MKTVFILPRVLDRVLADGAFKRDAEELLCFERKLHGEFLKHFFAESGDDHAHCVFRAHSALFEVKDLVFPDLRR